LNVATIIRVGKKLEERVIRSSGTRMDQKKDEHLALGTQQRGTRGTIPTWQQGEKPRGVRGESEAKDV